MRYSKEFSQMISQGGLINFATAQQKRIINIYVLEDRIATYLRLKEALNGTKEYYKYDLTIEKIRNKLTDQTGNLKPMELLQEMQSFSK